MIELPQTHLVALGADHGEIQVPLSLEPGIDLSKTVFLSRLIQRWGKLPLTLLNNMDLKSFRYGFIGTKDWFMHPLIPPGSLVVIDESRRRIASSGWASEFERPIYFLEHRDGYLCGWCLLKDGKLTVQPHPSTSCDPQSFAHPEEIEVVGQVSGLAMTLDPLRRREDQLRYVQ